MESLESLNSIGNWLVIRPVILVTLLLLPLFLAARVKAAYPSRRLFALAAVPALLTLGTVIRPELGVFILGIDSIIVALAMLDLWLLTGPGSFEAERHLLKVASLDKPHDVRLVISNNSGSNVSATISDDIPDQFVIEDNHFLQRLKRKSAVTFDYSLRPLERGRFSMKKVFLKTSSPWRLWKGVFRVPCESEINVYPDLKQIAEYSILARTNRLSQFGVRATRRVGQDNDFERLRDYNLDDNFKFIDWRTSARRQKLTVRDFQASQSQRVIFMIDCGRMMTNERDGLTLLDHALNASLMLSHVALDRGDAVGMMFFHNKILSYVPPKTGRAQMNRLLHASFDRHPEYVESRYDQAFVYLRARCLKRSMVVLMTSVIDEVNANQVQQYLGSLVGRHLPFGVMMRDYQMWEPIDQFETDKSKLFEAAAAAEILNWRHEVLTQLNRSGVLSIDSFPEDLTAPMINRYLEVKARHLL